MQTYSTGVPQPKTPQDFEDTCHLIYSVVFDDPTATKYGRSGQQQHGVDVFATHKGRRYGIQCKQKTFGKLTAKIIDDEVKAADEGPVKIYELIVATTAPNDAKLVSYVSELSDSREADGKFRVSIAFWDTLEGLVRRYPELQANLAPHMPGGLLWEQGQRHARQEELLELIAGKFSAQVSPTDFSASSIPDARVDSLNKLVDTQLDAVKKLLTEGRFSDALTSITTLGQSLDAFDVHQRSRWYTQRAHCYWHQSAFELAAADFDSAYELTPNDDKTAGNAVRGFLLRSQFAQALELAEVVRKQFPSSPGVFAAWLQASDRMGKRLKWRRDVPPEFRDAQDILYVFGWIELLAGRHAEAAQYAKRACEKPDVGFDHRALLILALVNRVSADGALASVGIVPTELRTALLDAIQLFQPLDIKLWNRQDPLQAGQTAACLGYAHMMTGNADVAKEFLVASLLRIPDDPQLHRACMESIMRAEDQNAAFEFGIANLDKLDDEGKLIVAEIGALRGDLSAVDRARDSLTAHDGECAYAEEFRSFRWLAVANGDKPDDLCSELTFELFSAETSISARVIATMVAHRLCLEWATRAGQALAAEITKESSSRDVFLVARACSWLDQHATVVQLLESRLPSGFVSEPHKLLFEALIRTSSRRKALRMLREFPDTAMTDADIRSLAVELAQDANDWNEMSRLSELQLAAYSNKAEAWVFRATVFLRQRHVAKAQELLRADIPLELSGALRVRGQLARLEIDFGARERGFRRLYLLFRTALADADAASAYLLHLLVLPPESLPPIPIEVGPGTAVTLTTPEGEVRTVIFDPDGISNLPKAAQFESLANEPFSDMAGKRAGEFVQIPDFLGIRHDFLITGVDSAHRYLAGKAQMMTRRSVVPNGPLMSVEIPEREDGQMDLTNLLNMLRARSDRVRQSFEAYAKGPVTLGILGQLLGAPAVAVASDWPQDVDVKLYVCAGSPQERIDADDLMKTWAKPLVVDLTAINELTANNLEKTLALFKPVYISTSAVDTLDQLITTATSERAKGHMREVNGQISMVEYDDSYHDAHRGYLHRVRACIEEHCEIVPAWGVDNPPEHFVEIGKLLDAESFDALQLCLEKDAMLLTVDGRLREIAKAIANIPGVWPQVYCVTAVQRQLCTLDEYWKFVLTSVAKRRTHTAVAMAEIAWALLQPEKLQGEAVATLQQYFGDAGIEISSAVGVITEGLQYAMVNGATLHAASRVMVALLAPLFARPDVHADEMQALVQLRLSEFLRRVHSAVAHPYEAGPAEARHDLWLRVVKGSILKARALGTSESLATIAKRPLDVAPVYAMKTPILIATKSRAPVEQEEDLLAATEDASRTSDIEASA